MEEGGRSVVRANRYEIDMCSGKLLPKILAFALPLMLARFRRNIRMPAWLGYALYPAHLALLYLLEVCL